MTIPQLKREIDLLIADRKKIDEMLCDLQPIYNKTSYEEMIFNALIIAQTPIDNKIAELTEKLNSLNTEGGI